MLNNTMRQKICQPQAVVRKWCPVVANEIKTFLGMTIAMELCQKSDIQDYWAGNETIDTSYFRNTNTSLQGNNSATTVD